jgi:DNA-binding NarL/FixJ family response regulator
VRVAVADRRRLIAEALTALIAGREGFTVTCAVAGDGAVTTIAEQTHDVVLVGAGAGADSRRALELIKELCARVRGAEIVIVADALEPALLGFVLDQGIGGLVLSDAAGGEVAACLNHVAHGGAVLPPGWQGALSADDPLGTLSERQMQVLVLLADGCSYEEIGARLFISLNTVKSHMRSIFLRLGVRNRMAASRVLANRKSSLTHTGH